MSRNRLHTLLGTILLAAVFACGGACACPVAARAEQLGSDVVCETAEQDWLDAGSFAKGDFPDISAAHAMVVGKSGDVYFERDADTQVKIASITKVMTAILALEHCSLTETVAVSKTAASIGEASAGLREGDALTVESLLKGVLIASGNDAAYATAEYVGKKLDSASADPVATFVVAMNKKASELGMDNTVFENPHGLDFDEWAGGMHSSARDVATMFAYAMKNETFRALTASTDDQIAVTGADAQERSISLKVHNTLLGEGGNIGGKTGTTYEAGDCFVGAFEQDRGGEVYTVVLHADEGRRFADTTTLARWYYGNIKDVAVSSLVTKQIDGKPLVARVPHMDWSDKTVPATLKDRDAVVEAFAFDRDVSMSVIADNVTGDVAAGDVVGSLTVQYGDASSTFDLVAARAQAAPSIPEWLAVQFDRLIRLATGRGRVADIKTYVAA